MEETEHSAYTQLRGTDEAFFQLMQLCGSAMLKLIGFAAEVANSYSFRSVEFKKKGKPKKRPDIEAIPALESPFSRVLMEFQGYPDKLIRYRSLNNMIQACTTDKPLKPVVGIIFYTAPEYKRAAIKLSKYMPDMSKRTIPLREIVLTQYTEEQLLEVDPRLILLAPFTLPTTVDRHILSQKCLQWTQQIQAIFPEPEEQVEALEIIRLFIFDRFTFLTRQEVNEMLNLDLMRSRAVQEVFHEGIEKGREEGITQGREEGITQGREEERREGTQKAREKLLNVLRARFGEVPDNVQTLLLSFESIDDFMELYMAVASCDSLKAFMAYCEEYSASRP